MHLLFERSKGRFKSNCNILTLAWMPYYEEAKFRQALLDYYQQQLINLSEDIPQAGNSGNNNHNNSSRPEQGNVLSAEAARSHNAAARVLRAAVNNGSGGSHRHGQQPSNGLPADPSDQSLRRFLNSRVAELYQRHLCLKKVRSSAISGDKRRIGEECPGTRMSEELDSCFGRMADFGWLVVGNVGKIVGVTLTSTVEPPEEKTSGDSDRSQLGEDLMVFVEPSRPTTETGGLSAGQVGQAIGDYERSRPDRRSMRNNHNLRGHLDEVILVKWNELYQKLATVDSKGNVLIWCKLNDKFTIQTPFYNRAKSVADFKWSHDGKTALICYTDSFILVGSSSGQRHWHSMLNLEDYHITCASWAPNDEQLLLGVSNGNVVIIDLPRSELTELVVNQAINIRAMCWSSSEANLKDLSKLPDSETDKSTTSGAGNPHSSNRRNSAVVNHRRLSRDCSVFSRYRYSSQGQPDNNANNNNNNRTTESTNQSSDELMNSSRNQSGDASKSSFRSRQRNILAIDFANGTIKLYDEGLDDSDPKTIQVNQESYIMQWSSDGNVLAVGGFNIHTTAPSVGCLRCRYINVLKFYNQQGKLLYQHTLRYTRYPITALTWAHEDSRLFVATGPKLHCAKVFFGVAPLALLAASCFQRYTKLPDKSDILESALQKPTNKNVLDWQSFNCPVSIKREPGESKHYSIVSGTCERDKRLSSGYNNKYQLPLKLQAKIDDLFKPTIRQPYDELWSLNDIIWQVPKRNQRYYCTLVCYTYDRDISSSGYQYRADSLERHSGADSSRAGDQYKIFVLYVEFQGSLVPILRARRVGFLKPEFVIFDPEDNQRIAQRQRKVSDVSQSQSSIARDYHPQRRAADYQYPVDLAHNMTAATESPLLYHNESFADNCADLHHLYSGEPRASNSSLGRQSMSDAEHYYNFECDTVNRRNQDKMVDLLSGRSHHQEPIAIPMTSSPYLLYSMALPIGNYVNQQARNGAAVSPVTKSATPKKRLKERHRLRGLSGALSESTELVRIKSNIWGTKFKMINTSNRIIKHGSVLGSVVYKASILHLQPRQILLNMKDMSNYCCLCSKHHHNRAGMTKKPHLNPATLQDNKLSMLDLPNPDSSSPDVLGGGRSCCSRSSNNRTRSKVNDDRHASTTTAAAERDKVVLSVGDSLKISDVNQRLRYAQMMQVASSQTVQNSPVRRSRHGYNSPKSREAFATSSDQRPSWRPPSEIQGENSSTLLQPNIVRYSSRHQQVQAHQQQTSSKKSNSTTTVDPASQEDVLTLSLGQGDQVRVEMSSIKQIESAVESGPVPSTSRDSSAMDDFLASNKTLKSIQTITKMIVDLSSKAIDDPEVANAPTNDQATDMASPSKLVKLSKESGGSSSIYVAPATPVHRPRRTNHLLKEAYGVPTQTQSATSTPLRFLNHSSDSSRRRQLVKRSTKPDLINYSAQPNAIPQPPPANVPLGRLLSSSAKRFIDGSLRSLYNASGSGGHSASDVEPEESEPLMGANRVRSFGKAPENKLSLKLLGQSQPCTPVKRALPKQSSDLSSFRSQLLHRLRGARLEQDNRSSCYSSSGGNKGKSNGSSSSSSKDGTTRNTCSTGSTSQLDKFAGWRLSSGKKALSRALLRRDFHSSSSDDDDLESLSDLSGDEADDDDGLSDSELDVDLSTETRTVAKGGNKFSWSNSVKDLRDFSRIKVDQESRGDRAKDGERRLHRKRRRKSICQKSGCCCSKEFKLKNRPPVWNELSQIYQLDFGGRVTQESAKNLQIDFAGNLALQFGRIDRCTYTLDYKYPFNAVQAMAVALASLTQRLK